MKKIILILVITFLFSCSAHKSNENLENNAIELSLSNKHKKITDGILVGKAKRTDLQQIPFNEWFVKEYNGYTLTEEMEDELESKLKGYTITIFMGTWCEDSQNQVPKFYKILEEVDFPNRKITLITMARDKTTPEQFEKGLNITNVPTFIFYKNGKEINRIVESPRLSLEQDILDIISNKGYKHTYEE
jgi:thiol-disulfide isomerase/thioredoxin